MTAIEFLRRYRPGSLVKSSARGEYQLAEHDSFKVDGESIGPKTSYTLTQV